MANRIAWLFQAQNDLSALHDYISTENERAADAYVEDILVACGRLSEFPLSGRVYNSMYRALVVRNHLIFHRFDEKDATVYIVAVLHGRQDISLLLPEE